MKHGTKLREDLATVLRELLLDKPWSQADTARELNTTQPRISNLQRGNLAGISAEQLVEWLAAVGHGVQVRVSQLKEDKATDRRYVLLEEGRKALDEGNSRQANNFAGALMWEFPHFRPGYALKHDVLIALGHELDARSYRSYKDEPEGSMHFCDIHDLV